MDALLAAGVFALSGVVFALTHLRFVSGWQMNEGRLRPREGVRELVIRMGFFALPGMIASGAAAGALVLGYVNEAHPTRASAYAIVILGLIFLASGGWAVKELYRPTLRRTPDWLANEGWDRR